jgi:hypothetical protein
MYFTHIINPFTVSTPEAKQIHDVTFASLRAAMKRAVDADLSVECLGFCFPNDTHAVDAPATPVPILTRSISDITRIEPPRRFPLLRDLLRAANDYGTGRYVVFTNMDIILQPYFYVILQQMLEDPSLGTNFFIVNRRTIPLQEGLTTTALLESAYREYGIAHEGWDCFVFPRAWIGNMDVSDVCIGVALFDAMLAFVVDVASGFRGRILDRQMLTAHLGDDRAWRTLDRYIHFNRQHLLSAYTNALDKGVRIPANSVAAYAAARLFNRSVPRPDLSERVLARLGHDAEACYWEWVSAQRRRLGMIVHQDRQRSLHEYIRRQLNTLKSTLDRALESRNRSMRRM